MKKAFAWIILFCWLISACGANAEVPFTATVVVQPTATVSSTPLFTPSSSWKSFPTQTPYPTWTPTSTITPTGTPTSQPPLVAHAWQSEGVLIVVDGISGDGGYTTVAYPPGFVLFFDGSLYFTSLYEENNDWKVTLNYTQLGRKGTCQLLNTIDQNGFFAYDPKTYEEPFVDGGPTTIITVSAWKSVSGTFYDLDHVVRGVHEDANFPPAPALVNTFSLLSWYEPLGAQLYEPDRIAVWIYENTWSREDYKPLEQEWNVSDLRLADLHSLTGSAIEKSNGKYVIYRSEIARSIFRDLANWNYRGIFIENDRQYTVFAQVLLPYQEVNNIPEERGFLTSFYGFPDHRPEIKCYPSDGVLPIPTPPSQ